MATGQNIVDEVRYVIHDENTPYRWSDDEMLLYVNAAIRQIIQLVPESNVVSEAVNITNSLAKQSLPSGGVAFVKVGRNASTDGTTFEGRITRAERDVLDMYDPDWEYDTTIKADAANFFVHYTHDPKEPKVYHLYPPNSGSTRYIELVYSKFATALTLLSDTYPLADEYLNAAVQYVIYRCLTKESRDTLPDAFRQELWENFLNALGLTKQARIEAPPPNPPGNL